VFFFKCIQYMMIELCHLWKIHVIFLVLYFIRFKKFDIVLLIFGNISNLKAIKYCLHIFKNYLIWERHERLRFWNNKNPTFGTLTWKYGRKVTFEYNPYGKAQNIVWGGEYCLLTKVVGHVKLLLEVVSIKSIAPLPFNLH